MDLRQANWERLGEGTFDVLVVGGGINGAVSAAALATRGARVALVDRGDFAGGTSQQSSNLAWGGIKYLESYELPLVRKLCRSRNKLMRSYPSTVQEIRFFVAHQKGFRHRLATLVAGSWLYWTMGSFFTRRPRRLTRRQMKREEPVVRLDGVDGGFEYSDAYLHDNDARFVYGFVKNAMRHGCIAANYVEVTSLGREAGEWRVRLRDAIDGATKEVSAKLLVNAAGPWADGLNRMAEVKTAHRHVFSKGIHLMVDRLTPHHRVLTFFADDGRLFFVIPMGQKTCIGTTDTSVERPEVQVTEEDRRFVLDNANKRLNLAKPLTDADIIAERCGVRPLVVEGSESGGDDWMHLSRKHAVEVHGDRGQLTIFGGKLTDCLNVGEEVCRHVRGLGVLLPYPKERWFGEPSEEERREFFHRARLMNLDRMTSPGASEPLTPRLWRRYGLDALTMLEDIRADPSMADQIIETSEYIRCELAHAARSEMIVKLEDFMRRRSKIELVVRADAVAHAAGLREACRIFFGDEAEAKLAEYFRALPASRRAA